MVARTAGPFDYYGDTYTGVTGDSIRAAVDPVDTHASDLGTLADELKGDEKRILETTEGDITTSVAANPHVPYDVAVRLGGKAQFAAACTREFALEVDTFDTEVNAINESYRSQVFAAQHDPDVRNGDVNLTDLQSAFKAIPRGQYEGGYALGLHHGQTMRLVILPQMIRIALPGLGNLWMILLKDTALVSAIGLPDILRQTGIAAKVTKQAFFFYGLACILFLVLAILSSFIFSWIENRARRAEVRH